VVSSAEGPLVGIPTTKPPHDKPNPKLGVGLQAWSSDSRFFLSKNDNMGNALWLWDASRFDLSALILQKASIKDVKWDPIHPSRLALCTGNNKVYFWRPEGCSTVSVPAVVNEGQGDPFAIVKLEWNPSGNSLLLVGKDKLCCCYLPVEW